MRKVYAIISQNVWKKSVLIYSRVLDNRMMVQASWVDDFRVCKWESNNTLNVQFMCTVMRTD